MKKTIVMECFNDILFHKSGPANKQHTYLSIYILHQEGRGQVNTIVMEHFNSILFHKSGLANKQHTYRSISTEEEGNGVKEEKGFEELRREKFAV